MNSLVGLRFPTIFAINKAPRYSRKFAGIVARGPIMFVGVKRVKDDQRPARARHGRDLSRLRCGLGLWPLGSGCCLTRVNNGRDYDLPHRYSGHGPNRRSPCLSSG